MPITASFNFYLDWIICAQFAGQCWAQAKGLYSAAALDVTLVPWQEDGRSIVDKVLAGGIGAGCAGIDLDIQPWRTGFNHQMDALDSPGNVIVSTEDNLHLLARARGKAVKAIGDLSAVRAPVCTLASAALH